ncbi:Uncharacterised protein [Candidatus Bilamarchaeum dharawalense]|uniref:Uncharacterized protein n=1 Tax=Candidatus Bilamarchaeum dharawalense TaxID=2885759 RepID=A0A5E4LNM9_9ARCH|nr:Uncharacterised protein [Candidatus Bilamarchaeum dharawalense]
MSDLALIRGAAPDAKRKVDARQTVSVFESISVLVEGFDRFQQRTLPSSLSGVSFSRIAGQACCLDHSHEHTSRKEILRILQSIKPGGVFLMLGHGGIAKCGAVGAKQALLAGQLGHEPDPTRRLLDYIPDEVSGKLSPDAEKVNALFQAQKILDDPEFKAIIEQKNITFVWSVCYGLNLMVFDALNRPGWSTKKLFERHPKLLSLALQMRKGLQKLTSIDSENLDEHYAHAAFLYDPMVMRKVLDPLETYLDIGGVCCVDARVAPNTPDGHKYLFRVPPNRTFAVTTMAGAPFSYDDLGSLFYSFGHVKGINSLTHHGDPGNGHTVVLTADPSLQVAQMIKSQLLAQPTAVEATCGGEAITLMGFDGKVLRIVNQSLALDLEIGYIPKINLLTV